MYTSQFFVIRKGLNSSRLLTYILCFCCATFVSITHSLSQYICRCPLKADTRSKQSLCFNVHQGSTVNHLRRLIPVHLATWFGTAKSNCHYSLPQQQIIPHMWCQCQSLQ